MKTRADSIKTKCVQAQSCLVHVCQLWKTWVLRGGSKGLLELAWVLEHAPYTHAEDKQIMLPMHQTNANTSVSPHVGTAVIAAVRIPVSIPL